MKKILLAVASLALVFATTVGATGASARTSGNDVTEEEALQAAINWHGALSAQFAGWPDAEVLGTVVYRGLDGMKTAYEFAVESAGQIVGFMLISATKEWMPMLECGGGRPPSAYLGYAEQTAIEQGYVTDGYSEDPVLLYWSGLSYSAQFGEKMKDANVAIDLPSGVVVDLPKEDVTLQVDSEAAKAAWAAMQESLEPRGILSSGYIYNVPAWFQSPDPHDSCDEGGGSNPWPYCAGDNDDPWGNWDGCTCIAGAMVHGYWGISFSDENLIDNNHHFMQTWDNGFTPPYNILDGVWGVFNYYGYGSSFTVSDDYSVGYDDIQNRVNTGRPAILSMAGGVYGTHSVTVVGYNSDYGYNYIILHDTWDTNDHWLVHDQWATAMLTTATHN